jgi:hypothetical protein
MSKISTKKSRIYRLEKDTLPELIIVFKKNFIEIYENLIDCKEDATNNTKSLPNLQGNLKNAFQYNFSSFP